MAVLRGHLGEPTALCFALHRRSHSPSSDVAVTLWSGAADGELRLWRTDTQETVARLPNAHSTGVLAVQVPRQDASLVYSQGRDGRVALWDVHRLQTVANGPAAASSSVPSGETVLLPQSFGFCRMLLLDDDDVAGRYLATAAAADDSVGHHSVCLWDVRCRATTPVQRLHPTGQVGATDAPTSSVMCLSLAAGRRNGLLAAGYEDSSVCVWDRRMADGKPLAHLRHVHGHEPITSVSIGWETSGTTTALPTVVTAGMDARLVYVQPATDSGGGWRAIAQTPLPGAGVSQVRYRPCDDRIVAAGGYDGPIRVYSARRGHRLLAVLRHHRGAVQALEFCPDRSLMASGGSDRHIALWDVYATGAPAARDVTQHAKA